MSSIRLTGEAEVTDHKDFGQMAQQLCDATGSSSQGRQVPRTKPLPKPPKELTEAEKKKEDWSKDVRTLQRDLASLSKLFLAFQVKGSQLVKDPQSGVTKELLQALENNYKQSITQDELVSQLIFKNTPVAADDMNYTQSATLIKKAKEFLANTSDLKTRASRIIGK
jgi:DNA repair exonuclease SbcCD nuclease subunit